MNEQVNLEMRTAAVAPTISRKPFAVYTIVETDGEKALWRRVGSGFVNRDGSYNLYLDALPINGRLHMRESDGAPAPLTHERT